MSKWAGVKTTLEGLDGVEEITHGIVQPFSEQAFQEIVGAAKSALGAGLEKPWVGKTVTWSGMLEVLKGLSLMGASVTRPVVRVTMKAPMVVYGQEPFIEPAVLTGLYPDTGQATFVWRNGSGLEWCEPILISISEVSSIMTLSPVMGNQWEFGVPPAPGAVYSTKDAYGYLLWWLRNHWQEAQDWVWAVGWEPGVLQGTAKFWYLTGMMSGVESGPVWLSLIPSGAPVLDENGVGVDSVFAWSKIASIRVLTETEAQDTFGYPTVPKNIVPQYVIPNGPPVLMVPVPEEGSAGNLKEFVNNLVKAVNPPMFHASHLEAGPFKPSETMWEYEPKPKPKITDTPPFPKNRAGYLSVGLDGWEFEPYDFGPAMVWYAGDWTEKGSVTAPPAPVGAKSPGVPEVYSLRRGRKIRDLEE